MNARPRYVTPRDHSRASLGHEVVDVARRLGFEPMPWQSEMLDTAMEIDESGNLYYSELRISVPRQSAKTTTTLWMFIDRMLHSEERGWGTRPQARYTAQHASNAREKLTEDWFPVVQDSPIDDDVRQYILSNGREAMRFENGGKISTFPPTGRGAHGSTLDLVAIDEAFAHADGRAETGSRPAMITRKSPQIIVSSTAGTAESVYWQHKVDDGRQRVESGTSGRVYFLEYSAGPDDDVHNPEHWPRWMPALGHTIDIDAIHREHDTISEDEFSRAYGNLPTGTTHGIFPRREWAAAFSASMKRTGRAWMAVDASPGLSGQGRSAAISIATWSGGEVHVKVLKHEPGLSWVADSVGELTREHHVDALYLDATGPIQAYLSDIKSKSAANVEVTDTATMVAACARFHQAVMDCTVRHRDQKSLNNAVNGATRRNLLDGWGLTRSKSTEDISPLVSCVLAHWGAVLHPETGLIEMYVPKAVA